MSFMHFSHAVAALLLGVVACGACRTTQTPTGGSGDAGVVADAVAPTVRIYFVSDLAGALEPCGCTKEQLGGVDRLGAFVAHESAPSAVTVAAGPLFFMDPVLKPDRVEQETSKAETIARALGKLSFAAFAPGANDSAAGKERLDALTKTSGGAMLAGTHVVRDVGGVKVGFVGAVADTSEETVKAQVAAARGEGAQVVIALAATGRGEAKRIADAVPDLTAIIVGSTTSAGDGNSSSPPAERVGKVIIAQAANHLQSVGVLDLVVRGGSFDFADASGIEQARRREDISRRMSDLRTRIAGWERDKNIPAADLDARRADLARMEEERAKLDTPPAPTTGSFFRYTVKEMGSGIGKDAAIDAEMLAYYKKVDDANKLAFAGRVPEPVKGDEASYIGIAACATCHASEKAFWDKTAHAHAYATLSTQFKEFNLDCVSCHVTGYEKPGGSTVTHVDALKDVQCEVCHGPGSKHRASPTTKGLITAAPRPELCLDCHHPPHVEGFDAQAKMAEIVGPGHGAK